MSEDETQAPRSSAAQPAGLQGRLTSASQLQQQQQQQNPSIGIVATLEWSLDTLKKSLLELMDPPVFEEMYALVRDFATKPAGDRFSPKKNADLLSALTNLLGDDDALSAAIPLCCQLAALESVWRVSEDLLKMRSRAVAATGSR
jgi:hypothetical protein